jgi:hypothetical protein
VNATNISAVAPSRPGAPPAKNGVRLSAPDAAADREPAMTKKTRLASVTETIAALAALERRRPASTSPVTSATTPRASAVRPPASIPAACSA